MALSQEQPQQPPRKKRKRKSQSYEGFCGCDAKLIHDYDPRSFACLQSKIIKGLFVMVVVLIKN